MDRQPYGNRAVLGLAALDDRLNGWTAVHQARKGESKDDLRHFLFGRLSKGRNLSMDEKPYVCPAVYRAAWRYMDGEPYSKDNDDSGKKGSNTPLPCFTVRTC